MLLQYCENMFLFTTSCSEEQKLWIQAVNKRAYMAVNNISS